MVFASCDKRKIDSNDEAIGKYDILADVMRIQLPGSDTTYAYNVSYTGYMRAVESEDSVAADLIVMQNFGPQNDIGDIAANVAKDSLLLELALINGDSVWGKGIFKGKDLTLNYNYWISDQVFYTVRLIATQDRE